MLSFYYVLSTVVGAEDSEMNLQGKCGAETVDIKQVQ